MRKKQHISQLENQVAELMTTVNSLLEVVTRPSATTPKTPINIDSISHTVAKTARRVKKTPRAALRWTPSEVQLLLQLWDKGLSTVEIGKLMGRSADSISNKMSSIRHGN
jgi:DNA-binding NarL/FixJ family response regulator